MPYVILNEVKNPQKHLKTLRFIQDDNTDGYQLTPQKHHNYSSLISLHMP
jgi:hypothetical protein